MKSAYKRGCTVTGNSHFLTFLRLLDKDAQTKWRPQTTDRRYSPLSHSVKVSSHEQGLQILLKPKNELKPTRRLCSSSAGRAAHFAHHLATPPLSQRKGSCTCSLLRRTRLVALAISIFGGFYLFSLLQLGGEWSLGMHRA